MITRKNKKPNRILLKIVEYNKKFVNGNIYIYEEKNHILVL